MLYATRLALTACKHIADDPTIFDNRYAHNGTTHSFLGLVDIALGADYDDQDVDYLQCDVQKALGINDQQFHQLNHPTNTADDIAFLVDLYFIQGRASKFSDPYCDIPTPRVA